jgi:hypothetical protein
MSRLAVGVTLLLLSSAQILWAQERGLRGGASECEAQIRAIRENYREAVERLRREMEAQIAAIRGGCDEGGRPGRPGHEKPGDPTCGSTEESTCTHSRPGGTKGNNGVGNGIDPQPSGNPPVNDGPGTGPGSPGNKGGFHDRGGNPRDRGDAPDRSVKPERQKGRPHDGGGPDGEDHKGPPPGKGKHDKGNPHEGNGSDHGKGKGGPPGGKRSGKS